MAYLHGEEVMHLDLKPANVLMGQDGTPLVSDFGLFQHAVSEIRSGAGTVFFRAPEVLKRDGLVEKPADVWSFGCTLACLLMRTSQSYELTLEESTQENKRVFWS